MNCVVGNNKISRLLRGAFRRQFNLEELFLTGNNLTEIRAHAWTGLQSLSGLFLAGNRIRKLRRGAFRIFLNVTFIDLSDNQLKTLRQNVFRQELFLETGVNKSTLTLTLALKDNPLKCNRKLCWLKAAERREMIGYVSSGFPKCGNIPGRDWREIKLNC